MTQYELFGGGSSNGRAPVDLAGDSGSNPTPPLQCSEIRLERISTALADSYSIKYHYLHRTAKNVKLCFGIFARGELHGIMMWGLPTAKIKNQFGTKWTQLELRRMYCDNHLPKNSESKCLAIAARLIKKLFPQCKMLIAYADPEYGHKGGIYKAAGWVFSHRMIAAKNWKHSYGWVVLPGQNRSEKSDKIKYCKPL